MSEIQEIVKEYTPIVRLNKSTHNTDLSYEVTGQYLLQNSIISIPTLIEPMLQRVGLACLAGSSDTGKSAILRQLAISIVLGLDDFLGFKINSLHNSAIYVSTEDDQSATSFLLSKQSVGYDSEKLSGLRFIFDTENLLQNLDESLTQKPADIVIIDCFADLISFDLKDTQRIRTFLNQYQKLSVKHECLFLFLHHTGKRTENIEPSKNNLLSGQGLEAKMRLVIELRADIMNPHERHLCIVKGNYLPTLAKRESYVLHFDESTFSFSNTTKRIPFEMLAKKSESDNMKAKYLQAIDLKESGMSYEKIATAIGYSSKGSVSKLFDRGEKEGWSNSVSNSVSKGNKGNDEETPF